MPYDVVLICDDGYMKPNNSSEPHPHTAFDPSLNPSQDNDRRVTPSEVDAGYKGVFETPELEEHAVEATDEQSQDLRESLAPPVITFQVPPNPKVVPVRSELDVKRVEWDTALFNSEQGTLAEGHWKVEAEAGAGATTLIMDIAAKLIQDGVDPNRILVVAPSSSAVSRLRRGIAARVALAAGSENVQYRSEHPLVRSLHSLAFYLLNLQREQPIRLVSGAEQDVMIRDLLQGAVEGQSNVQWPEHVREALPLVGFARELRDFLLRAAERGLGPNELEQLGRQSEKPLWVAAAQFLREYEQAMGIGDNHSLSASELLSAVDLNNLPNSRWDFILVDDAQHLDPTAMRLLEALITKAKFSVVAGNPKLNVFRFRGAAERGLKDYEVPNVLKLEDSHRDAQLTAVVAQTPTVQASYIADVIRRSHLMEHVEWQDMAVIVRDVKDISAVRRTLLAAGVPVHVDPTDMILSEQPIVQALMLAFKAATSSVSNQELESLALGPVGGADPVTLRRLLRGLRKIDLRHGGNHRALTLLGLLVSPNPSEELSEELLADVAQELTEAEHAVLARIQKVLEAGSQQGSVEEVLWNIWESTGLVTHLQAVSLRGGARGSQADRDLDAVMALFDAAGDWVERRPNTSAETFLRHVAEQELPTGVRDRRNVAPNAVEVLTAHGAVGREWRRVVVAGVQEGSWPALQKTGSLFEQEALVDLLDQDIDSEVEVNRTKERLKDESALFQLAISRATEHTYVTAVEALDADEVAEPSRFVMALHPISLQAESLEDTSGSVDEGANDRTNDQLRSEDADARGAYVRLLSIPSVVAELRRAVASPDSSAVHRVQAARQLARLANAGVPGAHPAQWWGSRGVSSTDPLPVASLSPSKIESAHNCPLRATLEKVIFDEETPLALSKGNLAHAFAEAIANGIDAQFAQQQVDDAFQQLLDEPKWRESSQLQAWEDLIGRIQSWHNQEIRREDIEVFTEVPVEVDVPNPHRQEDDPKSVTIFGYIDRLQKVTADSGEESYELYDFKTGRNAISEDAAENHVQLMAYQLALSHGAFKQEEVAIESKVKDDSEQQKAALLAEDVVPSSEGSASVEENSGLHTVKVELIYPGKALGKGKEHLPYLRMQSTKSFDELKKLAATLPGLLKDLQGPSLKAKPNQDCEKCKLISICPAQDEGRSLLQ